MEEFVSNEFALIAVQSGEPQSETAMAVVSDLTAQVRTLPAVQQATSLADIPWGVRAALGERLLTHPLIIDGLVSRDGKTNAILLQMTGEGATGAVRRETVARLKQIVESARAENESLRIILAGPYVTLIDMYDYVDRDLRVFSTAAFVLVLVTLGVVFRRPAPVLFALVVAGSATVCTLGVASAFRILKPATKVLAAESEAAMPLTAAFKAGKPVLVPRHTCFISGLGVESVLPEMWPLANQLLEGVVASSLDDVAAAIRLMFERNRIVVEGAGAVALAAALSGKAGEGKIVCVVSGGNLNKQHMIEILRGNVPGPP